MNWEERVNQIQSREDFVGFLEDLSKDHDSGGRGWDNADLSSYLEAAAAWAHDMDGYYKNFGIDRDSLSPWRICADILVAARIYE